MSDKTCSQQKLIVAYLRRHAHRGITSMEAFEKLNITKLTTRISELRASGYVFTVVKERTENAIFNRYFLTKEPGQEKKTSKWFGLFAKRG